MVFLSPSVWGPGDTCPGYVSHGLFPRQWDCLPVTGWKMQPLADCSAARGIAAASLLATEQTKDGQQGQTKCGGC